MGYVAWVVVVAAAVGSRVAVDVEPVGNRWEEAWMLAVRGRSPAVWLNTPCRLGWPTSLVQAHLQYWLTLEVEVQIH